MKKLILTLFLIFCFNIDVKAIDIPTDIQEYTKKPFLGMEYSYALRQNIPFLLIFADPNDVFSLLRLSKIGEMVYQEYKGEYNFCVVNANIKENEPLIEYYNPQKLPAVYIINTEKMTYRLVEKKYYSKNEMRKLLDSYIKKETH